MAAGRSEVDLGPFTSSLAARWVAAHPERTHQRLEGSLVSADLSGFTALSERLAERGKRGAEDLTAMVNACFTALIRAAAADAGDVLKFGGDALLVWFEGEDHAVRAVRAAARMQRAIGAARFRRAALSMSVGAHTDTFDHFLVGQPEWRELVVVGRPVSTTVELEAAATAGEVLISPALAAAVPPAWLGERRADGVRVAVDDVTGVDARLRARPRDVIDAAAAIRLVAPSLQSHVAALAGTSGEHRLATVVFAELEGTDESVADGAEVFARSVDALVRSVERLADRYGLLFLYTDVIADGLKFIVVAGAPTSTGEDEEAGLRFATDLVAGDPKHKLRVGVNRGRVFAGFLGSEERRTYTVMGDPVNLSARLMARAEPGQVLGSDEVVRSSRAEFLTTPVAPFLVKGKAKPISAHLVEAATGGRRSRTPGRLPLVGRDIELAQLRAAIQGAGAGAGEVIEIVGDAGIGKTRLVEAIADDPRVLVRVSTECQPYDGLSPFAGVRPLLRRSLGIDEAASPVECGVALTAVVERVAPAVAPMLPLIAVPFAAEVVPTPEADAIADEFRLARMFEGIVELLVAALPTTTLLVVEDIYYVDDASLQLLRALATRVPERPWALVITRRPEGPGLVVGEIPGTLLKLSPLPAAAVGRLAVLAVDDEDLGLSALGALAERSGGNPLFVLELVEASRAGVSSDDLPESIERLVASRIDRLDAGDRALLRRAAVVGRVFHTGLVNTLFATEGKARVHPDQWARLGEFVEADGLRRFRFRHALFRDVAYEGLPFARRQRMHRSVGELLEAGVAGEPDVALLSLHFWLAGDGERTWQYSVQAGDLAWESFAVREAIAAYRRALAVHRRRNGAAPEAVGAVAERLGDALERSADYAGSLAAYQRAERAIGSGADAEVAARLRRKKAVIHHRSGAWVLALRALRSAMNALTRAVGSSSPEQARLALEYSAVRHRQGRHLGCLEWARRAAAIGTASGDLHTTAMAENLVQVAITHGAGAPGDEHGRRALDLFRQLGDIQNEGKCLNNLGVEAYFRGDWRRAQSYYELAAIAFARSGDAVEGATAENNLGELLCEQGRSSEAVARFDAARQAWIHAGFRVGVAVALSNLGRSRCRLGEVDAGRRDLTMALERFEAIGASSFEADVVVRMAEASVLAGRPDDATTELAAFEEAQRRVEVFPSTSMSATRLRGWIALQRGDEVAAMSHFTAALESGESAASTFDTGLAHQGLAVAAVASQPEIAAHHRALALELLSTLGVSDRVTVPLPG